MNTLTRFANLAVAEPFRILFPGGMLLGIVGISLWPLFYAGVLDFYPSLAHSRLLIHGFLFCFVLGFLFTAGPSLLDSPKPSKTIVAAFLSLSIVNAVLLLMNRILIADTVFLFQIILLLATAGYGFSKRKDLPPPGFVLALAGLACGLVGSFEMLRVSTGAGSALDYQIARILLYQGFPILPLIGVGAFFFPKLTGTRNPQDFPTNPKVTKLWIKHATRATLATVLFLVTIYAEIRGHHTTAYIGRAIIVGSYLLIETPVFRSSLTKSPQGKHLAICCGTILLSLIGIAVFPQYSTSWLHGFFVCGLTGSIVLVATRVILGHSGNIQLSIKSPKPLLCTILALGIAAISRVAADYQPAIKVNHYLYAAAIWICIAVAWIILIAPKVRIKPPGNRC